MRTQWDTTLCLVRVVFARTHEGRRLIAHELTHVVQQSGADWVRTVQNNRKRGLFPISLPVHGAPRQSISVDGAAAIIRGVLFDGIFLTTQMK